MFSLFLLRKNQVFCKKTIGDCALPCKNTFLQHNCSILLCKMHPWRYAQSPRGRMDVIFIFECFEIHILQFYKMKTEKKVSFKSYGNQPFCLQNV